MIDREFKEELIWFFKNAKLGFSDNLKARGFIELLSAELGNYEVAYICKDYLAHFLDSEDIDQLNPYDMQQIARFMGDAYCEKYWEDLPSIARFILEHKNDK